MILVRAYDMLLTGALAVLGILLFLCLIRSILGPRIADRIVAVNMVGTMTNTLILALLGSSMVLIVYLYSLSLSSNQFISSSYLAIEVVSGISSSIGVILAVPLTVLVTAFTLTAKKKTA